MIHSCSVHFFSVADFVFEVHTLDLELGSHDYFFDKNFRLNYAWITDSAVNGVYRLGSKEVHQYFVLSQLK